MVKKDVKSIVAAPNSPELLLLKFLPLTYYRHFLAATLDFTSFFTIVFLRATLFFLNLFFIFTAWLFWIRSRTAKKLQSACPIKRRAATTVSYLRVGPVLQY